MVANKPKISVVTATYNAVEHLPKLIESLRIQTDKNFEWVVADGGSTDGTLALLEQVKDLNIIISSQPDFGIYDALNRAIKLCSGDYYVTAGADDYFYENAITNYYQAITMKPTVDIVVAPTQIGSILVKPKGKIWLHGMKGRIAAHSVGALISKKLHEKIGYYSRLFPIAADELFILTAAHKKAYFKNIEAVVGYHSDTGLSSINVIGSLLESFRVKLMVGENKYTQLLLLIARLLKNIRHY